MSSESDLASLIAAIYEAGMDFSLWPYALGRIALGFGAPSAGIARQGRTLSECWGFSSPIDADTEKRYIDYYHGVNPIWQRASSTGVGTVQSDTMVMPRRELRRTEFFNDFFVPADGKHAQRSCIGGRRTADRFDSAAQSAIRGGSRQTIQAASSPFAARGADQPQIGKAELNHNASVATLNHLEDGILFVDVDTNVKFANEAAEQFLNGDLAPT